MKKSITALVTLTLSACGGEEYFNSPAEDLGACIVGDWQKVNLSYPTNSVTSSYMQDGSYFRETITDFETSAVTSFLNIIISIFYSTPPEDGFRYSVALEKGHWSAEGSLFRHYDIAKVKSLGNDIDLALEEAYSLIELEPETPNTSLNMYTTHCDELNSTQNDLSVYALSSESPLTYTNRWEKYNSQGTPLGYTEETIVLKDNGRASRVLKTLDPVFPYLNIEVEYDFNYQYSNDRITLTPCTQSSECPQPGTNELSFYDRSSAILDSKSYFVRAN
jgi:hypothetical protein